MTEIFTNATVTTMDEERPEAEAFAVSEGVFTFVGTGEEAREYARRLESEGKIFVLRPLIPTVSRLEKDYDALMHFYEHGYRLMRKQYDELMRFLEK